MELLQAGETAPEFRLPATPDQAISLSEFRGKNVGLVFYPADWSPVCGDELGVFNELLPVFRKEKTEIVGISVDGPWCHAAFRDARRFHFPLLSDFEPKGAVSKRYGAYRDGEGVCERALFLVDSRGKIRWSFRSPIGVNPGADGLLDALSALSRTAETTNADDARGLHDLEC